jgi:hypothetical protein
MQHLNSHYREGGVAYEVANEKILHRNRQSLDVGSLAERRFSVVQVVVTVGDPVAPLLLGAIEQIIGAADHLIKRLSRREPRRRDPIVSNLISMIYKEKSELTHTDYFRPILL